MKISLKVDDFTMELEHPSEKEALELAGNILHFFKRFGVQDGKTRLADMLKENYEGKPGWKFTDKAEPGDLPEASA